MFAILDSVSCTGAYEFDIHPGETTMADVEAVIFFREPTGNSRGEPATRCPSQTIGLAPLTSMFWFGKNSERKFDDYRPEVHDSRRPAGAHGQRRNALASAGQSGR